MANKQSPKESGKAKKGSQEDLGSVKGSAKNSTKSKDLEATKGKASFFPGDAAAADLLLGDFGVPMKAEVSKEQLDELKVEIMKEVDEKLNLKINGEMKD
mmetsp:Transcript_33429/g.51316  ORF Transcript_33429/g.51316 Transcript_33429/m.51316 type:complete len:100 (+) Transcript_33429:1389-1688(+)